MIHLRLATPDDSEFLYNLKKQTLKEYITQIWGWNEKDQRDYYKKIFEPDKYHIIQQNGEDIGCLSIEEQHNKIMLNIIEITPEYQNKGIGSKLVKTGLQIAKENNFDIVIVVGHPKYYPRFGFKPAGNWGIKHPFDVPNDVFLALELKDNALKNCRGKVEYPKEYYEAM